MWCSLFLLTSCLCSGSDRHHQLLAVRPGTFNSFWVQSKFNSSLSPFEKQRGFRGWRGWRAAALRVPCASTGGAQMLQVFQQNATGSSYPWYYFSHISWALRFESGILPTFLERNPLAILVLHGWPSVDAVLNIYILKYLNMPLITNKTRTFTGCTWHIYIYILCTSTRACMREDKQTRRYMYYPMCLCGYVLGVGYSAIPLISN